MHFDKATVEMDKIKKNFVLKYVDANEIRGNMSMAYWSYGKIKTQVCAHELEIISLVLQIKFHTQAMHKLLENWLSIM